MHCRALIALLAAGCSYQAAAGVPVHVPVPDAVLLRIPVAAAPAGDTRARVAALQAQGNHTGEERYFGLAEQLVDAAPQAQRSALRLTKAQLLQHRHAFDEALQVLDALLVQEPRAVDARLMRAQILVQQMRAREAARDCAAIQPQVSLLVFTTCTAQVRAGMGDLRGAYALVQAGLRVAPTGEAGSVRSWSAGVAGELAQRLGDESAAGIWYEQSWRSDGDSHFARLNYADWLLVRQRYVDVASVVGERHSPADRLRQVLAQRDTSTPVAKRLLLTWSEAAARGETAHLL